jgi:hypothetical protein
MSMQWVEIDSWHLIEHYGPNAQGIPTVTTRCGLVRKSSGDFLDRLPGGSEKSCENCLIVAVPAPPEEPEPAPKKARKAK